MRFKARLLKEHLQVMVGVSMACEKIGKKASFFLDNEFMRITVSEDHIDSPRVFTEIRCDVVFSEYRIESNSQNRILFEIELDQFTRALTSGRNAQVCDLKMVKRGCLPCLCLETKAMDVAVQHDIPIRVLKASNIMYLAPPDVNPPNVALELPRGKILKTIVDRMARLAKFATLRAEQQGRIVLSITRSSSTIQTYYTNMTPRFQAPLDEQIDGANQATVKVDLRKLSTVLNIHYLVYDSACFYVTDNNALLLHVTLSPYEAGHVTYYVPIIEHDIFDGA